MNSSILRTIITIENAPGNYVELIYKIGLNDSRIINRHEYRGQLKEYAVHNGKRTGYIGHRQSRIPGK